MAMKQRLPLFFLSLALTLLSTGCTCGDDDDDNDCECEGDCAQEGGNDAAVEDDDDDAAGGDDDDDDESAPCETKASLPPGQYYFPIRVTLSADCEGTIFYMRERFDGSGDPDWILADSPARDIFIDRDTSLRYFSVSDEGAQEQEHWLEYDFPPKFRGIMYAHAGDQRIALQWEPGWDEHQPVVYRIYQPSNDAPIPTLEYIASADGMQIVIDDSIMELVNGTVDCFVVRAEDNTGMEDQNYVTYCMNPQTELYVDGAAPPGGDGSPEAPFNAIQTANDALPDSRWFTNIYVAGGTYVENLDFTNNDPPYTTHNRSAQISGGFDPADWSRDLPANPTIIDGALGAYCWMPGEGDLIDGFYLTNGQEGMLFENRMSITIRNCVMHDNFHYGILIRGIDVISAPSITSSLIVGNGNGIGMTAVADPDSRSGVRPLLRNLIVHDNSKGIFASALGGGPYDTVLKPRIRNVVISTNETGLMGDLDGTLIDADFEIFNSYIGENRQDLRCAGCLPETFRIEFCDILEPDDFTGFGLISIEPEFIDDPDNFHIQESSPLFDGGSPDPMFNDPDSTRNDMGAFGGVGGSWEPLIYSF